MWYVVGIVHPLFEETLKIKFLQGFRSVKKKMSLVVKAVNAYIKKGGSQNNAQRIVAAFDR